MMKKVFSKLFALVIGFGLMTAAFAQTYPYTNPTYTPNAVLAKQFIASGVASTAFTNSGIGTLSIQVSGTCTSLAGSVTASNNGTDYNTIDIFPVVGATSTAASAVSATGIYVANVASLSKIRFENTAVSGTACAVTMSGSPHPFSTTR